MHGNNKEVEGWVGIGINSLVRDELSLVVYTKPSNGTSKALNLFYIIKFHYWYNSIIMEKGLIS